MLIGSNASPLFLAFQTILIIYRGGNIAESFLPKNFGDIGPPGVDTQGQEHTIL